MSGRPPSNFRFLPGMPFEPPRAVMMPRTLIRDGLEALTSNLEKPFLGIERCRGQQIRDRLAGVILVVDVRRLVAPVCQLRRDRGADFRGVVTDVHRVLAGRSEERRVGKEGRCRWE